MKTEPESISTPADETARDKRKAALSAASRKSRRTGRIKAPFRDLLPPVFSGAALVLLFFLMGRQNHLLVHCFAELLSISIAAGIFMLVRNTRDFITDKRILFIGTAYLFVALIDLFHTLNLGGMGVFSRGPGNDTATQLRLSARFLESLSLLLFTTLGRKRLPMGPFLLFYTLVTGFLFLSVFVLETFPPCVDANGDLTFFTRGSGLMITCLLIFTLYRLWKKRDAAGGRVFHAMAAAVLATICSEIIFYMNTAPGGYINLAGDLFKVASFYLLYKAVTRSGPGRPYALLFRDHMQSKEKLRASNERWNLFSRHMGSLLTIFDDNLRLVDISPALAALWDTDIRKIKGSPIGELLPPGTGEAFKNGLAEVLETRRALSVKDTVRFSDELQKTFQSTLFPMSTHDGSRHCVGTFSFDITEQEASRNLFRQSEVRFSKIFHCSPLLMAISTIEEGRFLEINDSYTRITGYPREAAVGTTSPELGFISREDRDELKRSLLENGHLGPIEVNLKKRDGTPVVCRYWGELIETDGTMRLLSIASDITREKRAETERELTLRLLRLINSETDTPGLIRGATTLLHRWAACDAVGIRLKQDDDFPYFETRGFPGDFVCTESCIRARDREGNLLRSLTGEPVLECLCGMVLSGALDPSLRQATAEGSFRTNNASEFIAAEIRKDPAFRARGGCLGEGYESMVLVPLRFGTQTLGLLQFSDRGKDKFSSADVRLMERFGANLSTGLRGRQDLAALHASEARYRTVFDNLPIGVIQLDTHRRSLLVNPQLLSITGYSREEITPTTFREITHPDDLSEDNRRFKELLRGSVETYEMEKKYTHKDGHTVDVELKMVPVKDNNDHIQSLIAMVQDITPRKKTEQEMRQLNLALEQAPDAVLITDPSGNIQYVNPFFETLTGYTREEVLGRPPAILKSGKHDAGFYGNMWDTIASGRTWKGRTVNRRKNGELFTVEGTISPVTDSGGSIVAFLAVKRDITAELRFEEQLRQAQKMEAIGALAGGIAHDFNNILYPMMGYAEMLREDLPDQSLQKEYAVQILGASKRARDLTRQILAFSRQSAPEQKATLVPPILEETLKLSRSSLPSTIKIHREISEDCPPVLADPTQIHQVIMNLVTNAFHAMERTGGTLSVRLETVERKDTPAVSHLPGERCLCLTISDTGHGMAPQTRKRIFDPYYTTKKTGKGTGLGLSVVHGIIRNHNGEIQVRSRQGKGTDFSVYLPVIPRAQVSAPQAPNASAEGGNEHILLVDDEKQIIIMVQRMLERLGYRVTTRTSSTDALELFRGNPDRFHMIITDMTMPNMTGEQLAAEIKAVRPGIPILVCTGFSEKLLNDSSLPPGINGILHKPVLLNDLAVGIRKHLSSSS